jgi:predicted GNAT family acetyltransferase
MKTKKIYTLRDWKRNNEHQLYSAEKKDLRTKVMYWRKKVEKFGGSVQQETLARFELQYLELTGKTC